jgi:hypothetical protein
MSQLLITAHHSDDVALPIFKQYFFPIQVGASLTTLDLGIYKDNQGENISLKNRNYCELTAHYAAWKNLSAEYIGLMHYRRIFTGPLGTLEVMKAKFYYFKSIMAGINGVGDINLAENNVIHVKSLSELRDRVESFVDLISTEEFKLFDIVLPKPLKFAFLNVREHYAVNHCRSHFDLFNNVVTNQYPHLRRAVSAVSSSRYMYPYNMFVMRKAFFLEYSEMLFSVLRVVESKIELGGLDSYQGRIFGFLAERFLNYYVEFARGGYSDLKILELNTAFVKAGIN